MLGPVNHIAIAVPDLASAIAMYEAIGAQVSQPKDRCEHGVTVAFVDLSNTKIELLHPLGENSRIAAFLAKNPAGGIHHICFEVDDILATCRKVAESGVRILGSGVPMIGAHGLPVLFAHPKDFFGTLIEFEQKSFQTVQRDPEA